MINRVLIRTKVVQMLYSYLLTQSEFRIDMKPAADSSVDKRFAHRVYIDTLLFVLRLSGYDTMSGHGVAPGTPNKYFHDSKMARNLFANTDLREYMNNSDDLKALNEIVEPVLRDIVSTSAYRSYIRTKVRDIPEDVNFWTLMIRMVLAKSDDYLRVFRSFGDFTRNGFDEGMKMAVDTLEGYGDNRRLFRESANSLQKSLDKAYELYHALLWLPVELTRIQQQRLDAARHKYLPTDDDLNPNMKFADNRFVAGLEINPSMQSYLKENPVSWNDDPVFLNSLLTKVLESAQYKEYMESNQSGREEDASFWRGVMRNIILPSDDLTEQLESKSVFWNDDLEIMGTFVLKTIKRFGNSNEDSEFTLLPQYKDEEDAEFGANLFVTAVKNKDLYRSYIDRFINDEHWDPDRLAFMDIVVMIAAITELLSYPAIPVAVTVNEYVEIANSYSTPRSGQFINGILSSVIKYLTAEGLLLKN